MSRIPYCLSPRFDYHPKPFEPTYNEDPFLPYPKSPAVRSPRYFSPAVYTQSPNKVLPTQNAEDRTELPECPPSSPPSDDQANAETECTQNEPATDAATESVSIESCLVDTPTEKLIAALAPDHRGRQPECEQASPPRRGPSPSQVTREAEQKVSRVSKDNWKQSLMELVKPIELPNGRFQCPDCDKCYKYRKHVRRHYLSHTTFRPFSCPFCAQSFHRLDSRTRHISRCTIRKLQQ